MKGGSECLATDQKFRLEQGGISPNLCEGHIEITSIRSKSLARCIPRLCTVFGWNLERRHYDRRH